MFAVKYQVSKIHVLYLKSFAFVNRGDLEPFEVALSAEKCKGETSKKSRRKGSAYDREAKLFVV
jgi:hypothetical protein